MTAISGWVGTGVGVIAIGICVLATWFVHLLPKALHPWLHRFLIVLMYCGAAAVIVTPIGQYAVRYATDLLNLLGGVSTGIGHVAIVLGALFLLLSIVLALVKAPDPSAGYLAAGLVFLLALGAGGALHQLYAATEAPGQQFATSVATWLGG